MKRLVIVDTLSPELTVLVDEIESQCETETIIVPTVKEAKAIDSPDALILSLAKSLDDYSPLKDIPTILITRKIPVQSRPFLMASRLLDTVDDYSYHNCRYIISLLKRIEHLRELKVMVCEGEKLMETMICRNLAVLGVEPIKASTIKEALEQADLHKDISMILVSSQLSREHGLELVESLRRKYNKVDLPIVALMDERDTEDLQIQFLRHGATDTVIKQISTPLSMELFRSRILQNLRQVISYREMSSMAQRDFLTGMFNRRYFFSAGQSLYANYLRGNLTLAVVMIDIDFFKNVNDTYGHPAGDRAIISIAKLLDKSLRKSDLAARFGGEEFCVLLTGTDAENAKTVMDRIRLAAEQEIHTTETGDTFKFTISIGISVEPANSLEGMVNAADELLYKAKEGGRNKIVYDF